MNPRRLVHYEDSNIIATMRESHDSKCAISYLVMIKNTAEPRIVEINAERASLYHLHMSGTSEIFSVYTHLNDSALDMPILY